MYVLKCGQVQIFGKDFNKSELHTHRKQE